ncbi:MAG: acetyl-CoA C-acetyltransferase [Myxococcota bacterium]|nr:acetyl-CoA C-acetyltransferase [Myxococcota bacterium]
MAEEIVIVAAKRTAVGAHGGSLKNFSPTDMGVIAAKAALDQSGVDPKQIDHVVFGNVLQADGQTAYLPRHVGLRIGLDQKTPALLVGRMCDSGFQAIISSVYMLLLDEAEVVLAGGSESMSQAPFIAMNHRFGQKLGDCILKDALVDLLTDRLVDMPMAITAEELAVRYDISREACDQLGYESQMKAKAAITSGRFKDEIAPVEITARKKTAVFDTDEHPRMDTTMETLAKLKPVFKKGGVVTAGNASGIGDGAAALVLTTAKKAKQNNLKPLARIVSWGVVGCDPEIMGIGVVGATHQALKKAGLTLDDMALLEINEAFAAQYLAVEKEMGIDRSKVNVNGGAIALAHPVGCTGAKLTVTLIHEMKKRNARFGLTSACAGGGQGMAIVIERLEG